MFYVYFIIKLDFLKYFGFCLLNNSTLSFGFCLHLNSTWSHDLHSTRHITKDLREWQYKLFFICVSHWMWDMQQRLYSRQLTLRVHLSTKFSPSATRGALQFWEFMSRYTFHHFHQVPQEELCILRAYE